MLRIDPYAARRIVLAVVLPSGLLLALGCQRPGDLPSTYPASGKVAYTDGQPVQGGSIEFTPSAADATFAVTGQIEDNGNYTLHTFKGNQKFSGAAEGQYQVTILPPQTTDHQTVRPITLPGLFTITAGENKFPTFTIPRPPKRTGTSPR